MTGPALRHADHTAAALRQQGYAVVPSLLDERLLDDLAAGLVSLLHPPGAGSPLKRLRAWSPRPEEQQTLRAAGYRIPALHRITRHPALAVLMAELLGAPVWAQPRRFLRLVAPGSGPYATEPHQDYRYVQGALDTLTVWIPLHPVRADESCLRVVPGSHRTGLWPITDAVGGTLPHPVGITADDSRWQPLPVNAGDVVIFHSLTLHSTVPPAGTLARLSLDVRYQRADEPMAITGMLAPYTCPDNDNPRVWTHDSQLGLPEPLITVPSASHTEVTVPAGESHFVR